MNLLRWALPVVLILGVALAAEPVTVEHSGAAVPEPGDVLTVTAHGPAGGQASFSVGTIVQNVAMTEQPPGTYTGEMVIRKGQDLTGQTVTVVIRTANGPVTGKAPNAVGQAVQANAPNAGGLTLAHDAAQHPGPGDVVTVQLTGPPGGKAAFSIGAVVQNVPMAEQPAGTYTGTWVVRRDQELGGLPVTAVFVGPDGQPLGVQAAQPIPGAQGEAGQTRGMDNGQNGQNGQAGQNGPPQQALLLAHDIAKHPQAGDQLTVQLAGPPGGKAVFSFGDKVQNQPMTEQPAGTYTGMYVVKQGEELGGLPITATFTGADGQAQTVQAPDPIPAAMQGQGQGQQGQGQGQAQPQPQPQPTDKPQAPVLTDPTDGATVTSPLTIHGTAAPNSKVHVTVSARASIGGLVHTNITVFDQNVTADANGNWQTVPINLTQPIATKTYKIRAVVLDGAKASDPVGITVARAH